MMLDLVSQQQLTTEDLISKECKMLATLQFDVQWATPIVFAERFAQLLEVDNDDDFSTVVRLILKFMSAHSALWLNHHPALQAAVATTVACDIVTDEDLASAKVSL